MKKSLIVLSFLIFALSTTAPSYAAGLKKTMRDSMGRGYFEASQDNRIQSKKHFRRAFDLASKLRDWSAMIDAAGGLLALGEREDAIEYFEKITKMNKKMKDWRASIAIAYNYLSFPKNFIDKDKIAQNFEDAKKYASGKKDRRGLMETAKGFYESGSKERGLLCLELAGDIGREYKNYEAMDAEIPAKTDYLAKMTETDRKEKDYYIAYDGYYDYPYYRRFYSNYDNITYLPPDWLCEWSTFHMRRYNCINGCYVFLGW